MTQYWNGRHHSFYQSIFHGLSLSLSLSLRYKMLSTLCLPRVFELTFHFSLYLISNCNGKGDFVVTVKKKINIRRQDGDGRVGETDRNSTVKCIGNNNHILNLV